MNISLKPRFYVHPQEEEIRNAGIRHVLFFFESGAYIRMYVSQDCLAFSAVSFGLKSKELIPFQYIKGVEIDVNLILFLVLCLICRLPKRWTRSPLL